MGRVQACAQQCCSWAFALVRPYRTRWLADRSRLDRRWCVECCRQTNDVIAVFGAGTARFGHQLTCRDFAGGAVELQQMLHRRLLLHLEKQRFLLSPFGYLSNYLSDGAGARPHYGQAQQVEMSGRKKSGRRRRDLHRAEFLVWMGG